MQNKLCIVLVAVSNREKWSDWNTHREEIKSSQHSRGR